MKVLLAGGSGQLGRELLATAPTGVRIEAPSRAELSITDRIEVARAVKLAEPDLVINAAAYTAVDDAESDAESAFGINADGAQALAEATATAGARMIQISTDFVFDGKQGLPYLPEALPHPLGVYGESKLAGERAVLELLPGRSLVIRTSWLYSSHGSNFVTKILRLLGERPELTVVSDQIGTPTWTRNLADAIWKWATLSTVHGLRHFSDAGVASWYDFALAIQELAARIGVLAPDGAMAAIRPIRTEQFPTPARKPASSILDSFASWEELGWSPSHWREALGRMLSELKAAARSDEKNA